jgi:hypothetical protein
VTQLPFALIAACAALVGFQLVNLAVATPLVWLAVVSCSLGLFALMARFYSPLPRFVAQT